jgi:hypothetical protein
VDESGCIICNGKHKLPTIKQLKGKLTLFSFECENCNVCMEGIFELKSVRFRRFGKNVSLTEKKIQELKEEIRRNKNDKFNNSS